MRTKLLVAGVAGALLSACATAPPPAPMSAATLAPYRDSIELSGRLSVQYRRDGHGESLSGRFNWQQGPARTDVVLASPLGQTVAAISVTPQLATLTEAGQAPRVAADIDALSAQALGWPLPVSGLRDWLQGYAVAADGGRFVAAPGRARVTTRDGWRLHYVSWQDGAGPAPQPKRIDAERGAGGDDEVALRILLDPAP